MKVYLSCILSGVLLCALVGIGCAPQVKKNESFAFPKEASLAVASFVQPQENWEVLNSGYRPKEEKTVGQNALKTLNHILLNQLELKGVQKYRGFDQVEQCQEIVLYESKSEEMSALQYWSKVGSCVPADYILVPHVFEWRERKGTEWSVEEPAKVNFELYLLDVDEGNIVKSFHFEEEQKSLTENLLLIVRFFKRGARWTTAENLAKEGISRGLKELGL